MSEETSSAEPGPIRLLALAIVSTSVACVVAAPFVFLLAIVTPDAATVAPTAVEAFSAPSPAPEAIKPPVSRVKPLMAHLRGLRSKPKQRKRRHS
jgi:hypothetical protein